MPSSGDTLLERVVVSLATAGPDRKSILSQAASSFAKRPSSGESTIPTGFDPLAASLFEAVVEAAFLVANSDGDFDDTERATFESVVSEACQNTVQAGEVRSLVSDLCDQLEEDGIDGRVKMVASTITDEGHKHEVLRIAALMAHISGGVQDAELQVLSSLAEGFGLGDDAVRTALDQAQRALQPG